MCRRDTLANVEAASLTDTGLVRDKNEDAVFIIDEESPNAYGARSFGLYLVADGMGGYKGGEIASGTASRVISGNVLRNLKAKTISQSPGDLLRQSVELAHREILSIASKRPGLRSMGTTVTVALRLDLQLHLAHVGDSRAYLIGRGGIQQLTEDHSVVGRMLAQKLITPEQARTHADRGKIMRSLGLTSSVSVDTRILCTPKGILPLRDGDALVFCSDGLSDFVSDDEIAKSVCRFADCADVCKDLIELVNKRGGGDNASVLVVRVK